jgi:hypothetical protein
MRSLFIALAFTQVVGLSGCGMFGGEGNKEKMETVDAETFKKVVGVAKGIRKEPERAAELLKEAGMTKAELESAIYLIAADEESSDKYAKALKGEQ